jgi:hypothetical protein
VDISAPTVIKIALRIVEPPPITKRALEKSTAYTGKTLVAEPLKELAQIECLSNWASRLTNQHKPSIAEKKPNNPQTYYQLPSETIGEIAVRYRQEHCYQGLVHVSASMPPPGLDVY